MKTKVLFLLALTLLAAISAITTVAMTLKTPTPTSPRTTTIAVPTSFGHIQPTGDPIDDPIFPS